jgi:hypothetical protein
MTPTFTSTRIARMAAALVVAGALTFSFSTTVSATICIVPDNAGTADLPPATPGPNCTEGYLSPDDVHMIIDGLSPPGSTIEVGIEHQEFFNITTSAGGSLGGETEQFMSNLFLDMQGTGAFSGYTRSLNIPGVQVQTDTAPRTPGTSPQSFDTAMMAIQGQITGDPDFDLLRITAGNNFGMPSPGHTTLTQVPGGWSVDSFFDISYRIDFVGRAGGPFGGMSGSTTGTIRMTLGEPVVVYDHLECFKMKDTVKLKGVVNLPTLAGTPYDAAGCSIGSAKKWCTPAQKVVVSSTPPAVPLPGPNLTSDYICYKIKCPKVSLTQGVQDQFGTRTLGKMKQGELCVPAVKTP